jgi:hypothetical protein
LSFILAKLPRFPPAGRAPFPSLVYGASHPCSDIIGREENWFTRWTDFDFGDELDAKRSLEVY